MKSLQLGYGLVVLAALVSGCSGGTQDAAGNSGGATPMSLQGVVHGGQAPIVGTAVTLRAASQQGLSDATVVASATTDSNGNFNFSFTCPDAAALMYVTGTGGNPGGGVNSAIHLMSILGPCQSLHRSATINELTTVAAAYTLNGFIGPSGCFDCSGGLPASVDNISGSTPGLPNAMGNAALLVSSITGQDAPSLPTSAECPASGTVPANCLTVRKLNTAANALAACVNSAGPTSAQCVQLFDCATVGAAFTSGTACTPPTGAALPTDTLQAMLNIARNPAGISVPGIDDTASRDVVFSPSASVHFNDYTLSLNLTEGGFHSPENLAVDSAGNIWVTSFHSAAVTKLSPNGVPLSGGSGFAAGTTAFGIAIDANDNAWITDANASGNGANPSITVLNAAGVPISNSPITGGGLNNPYGIAVSPDSDVWAVNNVANGPISRFTATGTTFGSGYATAAQLVGVAIDAAGDMFGSNYGGTNLTQLGPDGSFVTTLTDASFNGPLGLAIDANGNLWVANVLGNNLTKITLANEGEVGAAKFTGGGLSSPTGIAIDASGNAWVSNRGAAVSEFSSAGVALSPSGGFVASGLGDDLEITPAVDPSGNVWFANAKNNSVTVFFGAAAPTRTPLVSALTEGFTP